MPYNWNSLLSRNTSVLDRVSNLFLLFQTGQWADKSCDIKSTGFVCQKPKSFKDEKTEDPKTIGCPPVSWNVCYEGFCL